MDQAAAQFSQSSTTEASFQEELLAHLGEQSGDIALQCSDTAGYLGRLNRLVQSERDRLSLLGSNMARLASNHQASTEAAQELQATARSAQGILDQGNTAAGRSLDELSALLAGIGSLEFRLTGFVERIESVDGISRTLKRIAEQSQILGLNASIEAARGGAEMAGFAVVANEMRRLSAEAEDSSRKVSSELGELNTAARDLVGAVQGHIGEGQKASGHVDALKTVLAEMAALVVQFQGRSEAIADCTRRADAEVASLGEGLTDFAALAQTSAEHSDEARRRLDELESRANDMLNNVAHGGVETRNSRFIDLAMAGAEEVRGLVEWALEAGELHPTALFDTDYREISGTTPPQYLNRFVDFADRHVRPLLDRRTADHAAIVGCCLVDIGGFLPTHITPRSRPQRPGEPEWNVEHSRNRQIFMDGQTRSALDGDEDFYLYTYRQDFGDGRFRALRSVLVPLEFRGRRWGLYELGYLT